MPQHDPFGDPHKDPRSQAKPSLIGFRGGEVGMGSASALLV